MSEFDIREFREAVLFVGQVTKKTLAEILNRGALQAVIGGKGVRGAIQRTPRADRGKIAALTPQQLAAAVKKRNPGRKMTREEWKQAIKDERKRRLRSIGYTAGPGWNNAAKAFGGRGVKGVNENFPSSKAADGGGLKATPENLLAELENAAPAADLIGRQALQDALNDSARDMKNYGERKLAAQLKKLSA